MNAYDLREGLKSVGHTVGAQQMLYFTVYHTSQHSIICCSEWVHKCLLCFLSQPGSCWKTDIMPKTYLNYSKAIYVIGIQRVSEQQCPCGVSYVSGNIIVIELTGWRRLRRGGRGYMIRHIFSKLTSPLFPRPASESFPKRLVACLHLY